MNSREHFSPRQIPPHEQEAKDLVDGLDDKALLESAKRILNDPESSFNQKYKSLSKSDSKFSAAIRLAQRELYPDLNLAYNNFWTRKRINLAKELAQDFEAEQQ